MSHFAKSYLMKKEYFPILICLLGLLFGINSCSKENPIPYVAPEKDPIPTNATDSMVLDIKNKYQSKIIYKWDRRYTSSNAIATPAKFENVLPYVRYIQEYWFDAYDSQSPGFSKANSPIEIVLVGSNINYGKGPDDGESGEESALNAAGLAMSLSRIMLGDVNNVNLTNKTWLKDNIPTIHHEFAHILDKKYGRPYGFDNISKGLYAGNAKYTNFTNEEARKRGFWRNYGMTNEAEDFATFVEGIVTDSKEEVMRIIAENSKLENKYNLVFNYYKALGIDLHELHAYLARRWN